MDALLDVGGTGFFPGIEEVIDDPEIRREIDLIFLLPAYQEIMAKRLGEIVASASVVDRIEAAKIIGRMVPNPPTLEALGRLLGDPYSEVVLYALQSAAVHRRPEHVPLILALLGSPMTRAEARTALTAYGPGIVDLVAPALRDATLSPRSAGPSPRSWPGSAPSAPPTSSWGSWPDAGTSWSKLSVDALSKVRAERPEVRFRKKDVRPEVLQLLRQVLRSCARAVRRRRIGRGGLEPPPQARFRPDDAPPSRRGRGPGLPEPPARHTQGGRLRPRAPRHHARPELKALLLPLLEDLPPGERAARLRRALRLK